MSYIFNKGMLLKELREHNIDAALDTPEQIDNALVDLAQKICDSDTFLGAGIDRSAFDCSSNCVLKVSKQYYVDYEDDTAMEDYYSSRDEDYDPDNDDYGWSFNNLDMVRVSKNIDDQSLTEIQNFIQASLLGRIKNQVFKIYAATTNGAIMLVERCGNIDWWTTEKAHFIYNALNKVYSDTHEDNFGINKKGKIVLLDLGFDQDWKSICKEFNVVPRIIKFKE